MRYKMKLSRYKNYETGEFYMAPKMSEEELKERKSQRMKVWRLENYDKVKANMKRFRDYNKRNK